MSATRKATKRSATTSPATGSIAAYDAAQAPAAAAICRRLRGEIEKALPDATSKVWHGTPVWFVGETPVVGYDVAAKGDVQLLFWNGQAFGEPALEPMGKHDAAQVRFESVAEIDATALRRWLEKAGTQLWDLAAFKRQRTRAIQGRRSR
jgi:hypothetical protein